MSLEDLEQVTDGLFDTSLARQFPFQAGSGLFQGLDVIIVRSCFGFSGGFLDHLLHLGLLFVARFLAVPREPTGCLFGRVRVVAWIPNLRVLVELAIANDLSQVFVHFKHTITHRATSKTAVHVSIDALVQQHVLVSRHGLMVPTEDIFEQVVRHALVKFVGVHFQSHVTFRLLVRGLFSSIPFSFTLLGKLFDSRHGVVTVFVTSCLGCLLGTRRGFSCNFRSNLVGHRRKDFSRGIFQDILDKVFFGDFAGSRSKLPRETEALDVNVG
mmetsp:Transcript_10511/g.20173  ORF Transcript_10511/g.20173 Transcript_10511/m.20173 type:complete len:270 (-) Transcript_10511:283-1092(-)